MSLEKILPFTADIPVSWTGAALDFVRPVSAADNVKCRLMAQAKITEHKQDHDNHTNNIKNSIHFLLRYGPHGQNQRPA